MKITETQLRKYVRSILAEHQQDVLIEGFFGDMFDKISGKKDAKSKLQVLVNTLKGIPTEELTDWNVQVDVERAIKAAKEAIDSNDKKWMKQATPDIEKRLKKIRSRVKDNWDEMDQESRTVDEKRSSSVGGINVENAADGISSLDNSLSRLVNQDDRDIDVDHGFDVVQKASKLATAWIANERKIYAKAKKILSKEEIGRLRKSATLILTIIKRAERVATTLLSSSLDDSDKRSVKRHQQSLEKLSRKYR